VQPNLLLPTLWRDTFLEGQHMSGPHISELVFEVTEEAEGGYSAECLTENIFTQGNTWEELRANVKEATEAYFYDGPKPQFIRLHLVRNEVLAME
jgi:predicted RNase H-like HicB family nuclease